MKTAAVNANCCRQTSEVVPEGFPKLMVLSVLPGCRVHLIHRFPSFLFRIGMTQIAVDRTIAETIYVRRTP